VVRGARVFALEVGRGLQVARKQST